MIDSSDPNKGIMVTYGGGDKCTNGDDPMQNGKPRQTQFKIHCSAKQSDVIII
jgi:hypothetical protein